MPTVNVNLTFSSDDGIPALFTDASGDGESIPSGVYDSGEGNPAGSMRFDAGANLDVWVARYYLGDFETFGVPSGATVDTITNWSVDAAHVETGTILGTHVLEAGLGMGGLIAEPGFTLLKQSGGTETSGDESWSTLTQVFSSDSGFPRASTELFYIFVGVKAHTGSDGATDTYYDNITFDINYSFGAGVTGSGVLQAQPATVAGYALLLPSGGTESIREPSQDDYRLIINGAPVLFTSFTVRRYPDAETARISLPRLFADLVVPSSAVTINIESYDVYGNLTVIDLFTGTLESYSASGNAITMQCAGVASYPENVVRDFGDVSYTYDDGNLFMYRARVDPRFYPGDIGMFGLRRIDVDKVVYTVDSLQAVMGLMSNGQV